MKQTSFISLQLLTSLLFLFLLIQTATAYRPLNPKLGEDILMNTNGVSQTGPMLEMVQKDSDIDLIMGVEDCGNGDEECLKRRMISEAHLDYIYTQHHKP